MSFNYIEKAAIQKHELKFKAYDINITTHFSAEIYIYIYIKYYI